ncbi:nucleotidyltransferase domain-containing protein [Mesorhizobium sp.]|uniref:nucleotidyltransferase domain-containing protein n=1 Tax=Mesorhizobium sp. TaxID=1871066 RepID=UPI0025BC3FD2|nr:nucleotidyltransferase domain-containing protein [Mesorhizobium sp.]
MLGVDSNLRVLRTLVEHGGLLAASEIVRRSRLSRESVRLGLLALESLGIVAASGSGHSRLYRFDDNHYLAPALAALFKAESNRFTAILDAVRQSAAQRPVFSLFVYGSAARGDDGPDSDLDIGLVARADDLAEAVEGLREALRGPAERLVFLPNVVGLDFDDVRRLARDRDPWWENVKQDAIVLSGSRPEDAVSFQEALHG